MEYTMERGIESLERGKEYLRKGDTFYGGWIVTVVRRWATTMVVRPGGLVR